MVATIVVDTSVFISSLLGGGGASREIIRRCLEGRYLPLMGVTLYAEYEAVCARRKLFEKCALDEDERTDLLNAFLSTCRWTKIYFSWRPNLRDEGDNHLLELAVAGGAEAIVTKNARDFTGADLRFFGIRAMPPASFLKEAKDGDFDDPSDR